MKINNGMSSVRHLDLYIGESRNAFDNLHWWAKLKEAKKPLNSWIRGKFNHIWRNNNSVPKVLYPVYFTYLEF